VALRFSAKKHGASVYFACLPARQVQNDNLSVIQRLLILNNIFYSVNKYMRIMPGISNIFAVGMPSN
jgi:hypothetical protein